MRMERTVTIGETTLYACVEDPLISANDERGSYRLLELLYRCTADPSEVPITPLRFEQFHERTPEPK